MARYAKTIGQVLEALLAEAKVNRGPLPGFWAQISTSSAELVESIVLFESKLAQATPDEEDAEDVTKYYNPMNLDQIKHLLPQLSVQYLISTLAPAKFKPEKLIVGSPSYLKALSEILRETSAEALQAYFVWKTVQAYAYKVEDDALKPLKRFNNELLGKDPDASEERWRTCIKVADRGLGTCWKQPTKNLHLLILSLQVGYSASSLWRKHSRKKLKNLVIRLSRTSRRNSSRN